MSRCLVRVGVVSQGNHMLPLVYLLKSNKSVYASFVLFASSLSVSAALNAPSEVTAHTAGPATIALSWNDNEATEDNYIVQRDDSGWATIATLPAGSMHYYDRGLALDSTHNYRVYASNSSNVSVAVESGAAATLDYQPNIIFFLADDMGYKDLVGLRNEAIDGPTIYETPALDSFIETAALSINNAYCSGPRCVVARRSIQTGKYDWRPEAVPNNDYYVDHAGDPIGGGLWAGGTTVTGSESGKDVAIPYDNETYGEALQDAGYRTCFIGKYHLGESPSNTPVVGYSFGDQPARGPDAQGYDVSIAAGHAGAPPASYFSVENMHATGTYTFELPDMDDANYGTAAPVAGEYITDRMTDKAIGFIGDAITNHTSEPFAMTLAHYAVHTPAEAKLSDINDFKAKKASMAAEFAAHPAGASGLITDYTTKTRVWQDNAVYAAMMKSYDDSFAELRTYLANTNDPRNPGKLLSETTIIVVSSDHGGKSTTPIDDGKALEDDIADDVNPAPTFDAGKGAYKSGTPNAYSSYPTSNYPYRQGKTWVYEGGLKVPLLVYIPGITVGGSSSDAFVHHADLFATFVDMAGGAQSAESTDSISFMLTAAEPTATARDEMHHFFTNANTGTGNPALGAYRKGDYKLIYFMVQRRVELYNLVADPYEQNDLAESRPELAAEMLNEVYQQALSTGMNMPKPGSNTWESEQAILVDNDVVGALPALPDANPSELTLTELSPRAIQLDWTVNASNATHSVVYRRSPTEGNYREHAYVPVGTTTFRDLNLTPGGLYRYRIESENLAGWSSGNTGNKTHTLSASGTPLAINAVDDDITTVPGELRRFNPLLNDEGEGALTITAITPPTSGTATIDGQWIRYQAASDFAGSVTMTYTIADGASQSDTATVTFDLPISSSLTELQRWDFDESVGTNLEATQSSSGLQFNGSTANDADTDANGNLLLTVGGDYNLDAGTFGPYTSGKYQLKYHITAADLSNASTPAGSAVGFAFRDTVAGKSFGTIRIRKQSGKLRLELRKEDGTGNNSYYVDADAVMSDLIVTSTLDLDAGTITTEATLAGSPVTIATATHPIDPAATQFNAIRYSSKQSGWSGGDSVSVEYLSLTALADAPSLYTVWSTAYPWLGEKQTAPTDDPDLDGLNNLLEFAFGTSLVEPSSNPVVVGMSGSDPVIEFTPARDTSEITYTVQHSDDLSDWSEIPEVIVTSPAGQAVQEALPAGTQGFSRVQVEL